MKSAPLICSSSCLDGLAYLLFGFACLLLVEKKLLCLGIYLLLGWSCFVTIVAICAVLSSITFKTDMAEVIFLSAAKSASVFVHCSTCDIKIITLSSTLFLILATSTCCCSTVVSNNDVRISLIGRQSPKFTVMFFG